MSRACHLSLVPIELAEWVLEIDPELSGMTTEELQTHATTTLAGHLPIFNRTQTELTVIITSREWVESAFKTLWNALSTLLIGISFRVAFVINGRKDVRCLRLFLPSGEQRGESLEAYMEERLLREIEQFEDEGRVREFLIETPLGLYGSWVSPKGKAWLSRMRALHLGLPWAPACIACARDFPRTSVVDWHVAHAHTDIVCSHCSEFMDSPHHLKAHQEATHGAAATWSGGESGSPFHCIFCQEQAPTWEAQREHVCASRALWVRCSGCNKDVPSRSFSTHECTALKCPVCGASAANAEMLERHRVEKHTVWVCQTCGKQCQSLGELRIHTTAAHQPQTCALCGKKFDTIASREVHEGRCLLRPDIVPFMCGHCPFITASESELYTHVGTLHPLASTLPPRYPCPAEGCKYLAYYPGGVYQHMNLVHPTLAPAAPLPGGVHAFDEAPAQSKRFDRVLMAGGLDEDTQRAIELSYADLREHRPNPIPRPATDLYNLWQVRTLSLALFTHHARSPHLPP
jgi:hypothetical protein